MAYDKGDLVRISGTFKVGDVPTNPSTVTLKIKKPDNTVLTYVYGTDALLIQESTGNYYFDLSLTAYGLWYYRWIGTGMVEAEEEAAFVVNKPNIT